MTDRNKPILTVVLIAALVIALGVLAWQLLRAGGGETPQSVYPKPMEGQPTVEEVGPPPDVVPAATPGTPAETPMKGR